MMFPGLTVREIAWAVMRRQVLLNCARLNHLASLSQLHRTERTRGGWIGNAMLYATAAVLLVILATV